MSVGTTTAAAAIVAAASAASAASGRSIGAAPTPSDSLFLALPGAPAYSTFRTDALQSSINSLLLSAATPTPKVTRIRTLYVHYINPAPTALARSTLFDPTSAERLDLETLLLDAGAETGPLSRESSTEVLRRVIRGEKVVMQTKDRSLVLIYVSPRKGTISPWSSKATSIAHVCGLEKLVERIERGVLFGLETECGQVDVKLFRDLLYDRMTEVCMAYNFILQLP